jgi:hypothetical protein
MNHSQLEGPYTLFPLTIPFKRKRMYPIAKNGVFKGRKRGKCRAGGNKQKSDNREPSDLIKVEENPG